MSQSPALPPRSDRPHLEQKKKLAKELLKAVQRLDGQQAARFTWNLPRFRGQSGQDVIRAGVSLADAQHVIARESGFASWPQLVNYIRDLEAEPNGPTAAFENAVHAIIRGDVSRLRDLLREHPDLVTIRSPRHHRGVLLHYIAANGVENEHQITPPNAVEVAEVLFNAGAGAVVDATADFYGGGGGSTPLVGLVTSEHPHHAGVQAELVHVFCRGGAKVDGIDDDCLPLASALGFRYPKAAVALAECGATVNNLPAAAGLGRIDLVRQYVNPAARLVSAPCMFPNPHHDRFPASAAPHPAATLQQALVFACMCGQRETAELLLDHGVDINGGPRRGITALHETAYQGRLDMVRFLLERCADLTLRDQQWDSTPIGWADAAGRTPVIDELFRHGRVDFPDAVEQRRYDVVRNMLAADASLANAPHGQGAMLRYAAFHGDLELANLLLNHGADPTLANESGHTALDLAEKAGRQEMIALLREKSGKETDES